MVAEEIPEDDTTGGGVFGAEGEQQQGHVEQGQQQEGKVRTLTGRIITPREPAGIKFFSAVFGAKVSPLHLPLLIPLCDRPLNVNLVKLVSNHSSASHSYRPLSDPLLFIQPAREP